VTIYAKLFDLAHLNKGDGLAWASQSNVTARPSLFIISSNLDLGGNRGGLLPTGSKNEKGERFTYRGINRYLHICFNLILVHDRQDALFISIKMNVIVPW